jgi:hypothetical protein
MEPLAFARRALAWRWTPCVAPVMGSVLIALLTLAVVPDELGVSGTRTGAPGLRDQRDKPSGSASDDTESVTGAANARYPGRSRNRSRPPADGMQDMPDDGQEAPMVPSDPMPRPEPPLPASTATVLPLPGPELAAPPPVDEPGTLPPMNVPFPPPGTTTMPPNAPTP